MLVTGMAVSIPDLPDNPGIAAAWLLVAVNTILRTRWSLDPGPVTHSTSALLLLDLGAYVTAAVLSGGWESAFVLAPVVDVLLVGFGRGYREAFVAVGLTVAALGAAAVTVSPGFGPERSVSQVILIYALSAVVAGYARGLFLEAEVRQEEAAGRLARLTEANALLAELQHLAHTLPLSLDLEETLASAAARARQLFEVSAFSVLVCDPATGSFAVGLAEGARLPGVLAHEDLPPAARSAVADRVTVAEPDLAASGTGGLAPGARSGLYAALVARDRLVGLAALEHTEPGRYGPEQADLATRLARTLALAVDNAVLYGRLRVLGAETERARLARQLHDRVGQGFAYVAMELDRIRAGPEGSPELARLADDTRGLLREVREMLHQLRADVDEHTDLAAVARAHLERFSERTAIESSWRTAEGLVRPALGVEREFWRILQEALLNVERHSGASHVWVTWGADGSLWRLQVRDDGCGFDPGTHSEGAGMLAIRQRARAIGARLSVEASPGQGTLITVEAPSP
ncbi:MAG: GAF domain-containing sensor histidine kinase [Acidimicrobiia bacterium]